jgi:hypothetical protein
MSLRANLMKDPPITKIKSVEIFSRNVDTTRREEKLYVHRKSHQSEYPLTK